MAIEYQALYTTAYKNTSYWQTFIKAEIAIFIQN